MKTIVKIDPKQLENYVSPVDYMNDCETKDEIIRRNKIHFELYNVANTLICENVLLKLRELYPCEISNLDFIIVKMDDLELKEKSNKLINRNEFIGRNIIFV